MVKFLTRFPFTCKSIYAKISCFLGRKRFATKGWAVTTVTSSSFGGASLPDAKFIQTFNKGLAQAFEKGQKVRGLEVFRCFSSAAIGIVRHLATP